MDVICEGILDLGTNPKSSSSKDWKPRLFVLRYQKDTKLTTLEYYKDTKKRWQKQVPKGVIPLPSSFQLSLAHNCSYRFPMKLVSAEGQAPVYLSAKNFPEMNMWYNCLQKQRILEVPTEGYHEYQLTPRESQSMTLIGASSNPSLLLSFTPKKEIICVDAVNRKVFGVWPYSSLRKYWYGDQVFGFEAGRRSPRGEGRFEFETAQGEEIYQNFLKLLDDVRATSSSPQSGSGGAASKDVDTRPPAPLPSDSSKSELGDGDSKQSKRSQSVIVGSNTTEVSGTSPVYHRRVHTAPNSREHKWLHEVVSPTAIETPRPEEVRKPNLSPPAAALSGEDILSRDPVENTYSHTVHQFPERFQQQLLEHSAIGGNIYNALVHQQSSTSIKRKGRPDSEAPEELMYDLAYPTSTLDRRALIPQDGEYAIASHPEPRQHGAAAMGNQLRTLEPVVNKPTLRYVETEPAEGKSRIDNPLYSSKEDLTEQTDDAGLMDNPLYGSQENLFSDGARQQQQHQQPNEVHVDTSKAAGVAELATLETSGGDCGGSSNGLDDNSLTINPIYGTHGDFVRTVASNGSQSIKSPANTTGGSGTTDFQTGQVRIGETQPPPVDSERRGPEMVPPNQETPPPIIQRDAKGYSKIDKNKKTSDRKEMGGNSKEEGSSEDDVPPPIPPRNYSEEGESPESDQQEQN